MKTSRIKLLMAFFCSISLLSCSKTQWYQSWFNMPTTKGCHFDSEFSLNDGESRKVTISSEESLVVGYVVSENEVFTNNSDSFIFCRVEDRELGLPRDVPLLLRPDQGMITAFVKNVSGVNTKVMIWTAIPGDSEFMDTATRSGQPTTKKPNKAEMATPRKPSD